MMSHEYGFLNSADGDWFLSHLNDNDIINHNNSNNIRSTLANSLPFRSTFDHSLLYMKVQYRRYLCGACGENVLEQKLNDHHSMLHPETPFMVEMYELFEIDERFKCVLCDFELYEVDRTNHLADCHGEELANNYTPAPCIPTPSPSPPIMPKPLMSIETKVSGRPPIAAAISVPGTFLCLACGVSNIHQNNLQKHRKKLHANIPHRVNIFTQQPDRQKFKCSICEKLLFEKNIEKHYAKYHPDKCGDKKAFEHDVLAAVGTAAVTTPPTASDGSASNGFRNIRVSCTEFQRLHSQNRIYESNGWHYLKDS